MIVRTDVYTLIQLTRDETERLRDLLIAVKAAAEAQGPAWEALRFDLLHSLPAPKD